MTCDRCGLEVLEGEATAMYGGTGALHHPNTCFKRLKSEISRLQSKVSISTIEQAVVQSLTVHIDNLKAENAALRDDKARERKRIAEWLIWYSENHKWDYETTHGDIEHFASHAAETIELGQCSDPEWTPDLHKHGKPNPANRRREEAKGGTR